MANNDYYTGKVAFVTGAASGIGRATAIAFAAAGASVTAVDTNAEGLNETARTITEQGGRVLSLVNDVSDPAQVEQGSASSTPR